MIVDRVAAEPVTGGIHFNFAVVVHSERIAEQGAEHYVAGSGALDFLQNIGVIRKRFKLPVLHVVA